MDNAEPDPPIPNASANAQRRLAAILAADVRGKSHAACS
jgi:hypothetical protein